ncbi:uncharacterized protein CYBJADRAFT_49762 [Cyberlindnera jadinii NRRL Y-1542]|uniref:Uncharacterized protein n=1 Tax=Cyberlindnera jadinii (strain ATCC 18201 / CBS 1600 / BCRC 20928 / JCM 3617 / NBRC 0987 / NRRL Y-1542) TaxID=983966 RepID=A0A1E4S7W8_CYBJN|nr:hypothetical protein CYBJADRAFT_49762 [Cyberlindnera jadinii NRRL Y-1542]ODV75568.1 hypothetical protein CYBJADRAFT_49762 [Cyberlindnera jadinii NRRL Y-1542]
MREIATAPVQESRLLLRSRARSVVAPVARVIKSVQHHGIYTNLLYLGDFLERRLLVSTG